MSVELQLTTSQGLTVATSTLLTAAALIIPKTRTWFESKDADTQKAIRGIAVIVLAVVFVIGGCAGLIAGAPACTVQSIGDYLIGVVLAAVLSLASTDGVFLVARKLRDRNGPPHMRMIGAPVNKLF
jgi:hypothetical protein